MQEEVPPADVDTSQEEVPMSMNAVAPESRLSQANIANPVGMRGMPTPTAGAINPNTMARGQQLFNKPGEITFAAQGGIMSTNKAFQRVA